MSRPAKDSRNHHNGCLYQLACQSIRQTISFKWCVETSDISYVWLTPPDKRIRDRALSSLRTYLHRTATFDELELRKLWKGLYYCMWMSDKPRNQQNLARDLADLITVVASTNFLTFADAFWKTIAAEWGNIDRLRLDKFLYLIRCYVNKGFEYVSKQQWKDNELLAQYLEVLQATPLDARDARIPNGLRYHVIDIYVDELDKVDTSRKAPLQELLAPLKKLRANTITKAVKKRVDEALEDERLQDWTTEKHEEKDEDTEEEHNANEDDFDGFGE